MLFAVDLMLGVGLRQLELRSLPLIVARVVPRSSGIRADDVRHGNRRHSDDDPYLNESSLQGGFHFHFIDSPVTFDCNFTIKDTSDRFPPKPRGARGAILFR